MPAAYRAPLYSAGEPASEHDFQIHTRYVSAWPTPALTDILRRHGISAEAVYLRHGVPVGASLDPGQLAVLRTEPEVDYVERD